MAILITPSVSENPNPIAGVKIEVAPKFHIINLIGLGLLTNSKHTLLACFNYIFDITIKHEMSTIV